MKTPDPPGSHASVNPGNAKAEMGYLRSVHHQNRSVGSRYASTTRARTGRPRRAKTFQMPDTKV
jgi:hypothetical protein